MKTTHCDVLVIGLGPAGMAVSIMAHEMGLSVVAIERHAIGGECLNVGCIPSKALLKSARARHEVSKFSSLGLAAQPLPEVQNPFGRARAVVEAINSGKTAKLFEKIDVILGEGDAVFKDPFTVEVKGVRTVVAKKIFICTGTSPAVPSIPGIQEIDFLTNENIFELNSVPGRLGIIGGGAIGCEMGQAFQRLGSAVSIFNADSRLLPRGDAEASALLETQFRGEGIEIFNDVKITSLQRNGGAIEILHGENLRCSVDALLIAAGRKINLSLLSLESAGVVYDQRKGIEVNEFLQTSQRHIYAVGDCNGYRQFTHAAMHQGMIALMNAMSPWPLKRRYHNYVVPWSVFTEPEISQVGETEAELRERGVSFTVIKTNYADYGRSTADGSEIGFVKALVNSWGKIYGVTIAGEHSSEMIHEFALAIQTRKTLLSLLFLQHSFPTFSFMNKRISEQWLMMKMKNSLIRRVVKFCFRVFS